MSMTPSARFHADRVMVVVVVVVVVQNQVWWVLLQRIEVDGMMVVVEGAVGAVVMVQRT